MSPVKKKGKSDRSEANKYKRETGGSLWDMNFDRSGFVKYHFNLHEDFEAVRKSNHSNLF